jgi:hypothetical protein
LAKAQAKSRAAWLADATKRLEAATASINKDICKAERQMFEEQGVIRAKRR